LKRSDRLNTFESNYGRDFGWFVEKQGAAVAALVDPQPEDMFWDSYRLKPVGDASLPEAVFAAVSWHAGDLVFRNRATGEVVRGVFAGGMTPTRERPRVTVRALYSGLRPTLLERVIMWYRRSRRTTRNPA
jgi:hypothetical protein